MNNLVVDIGNTRLKAALFSNENKIDKIVYLEKPGGLNNLISEWKPEKIIISAVNLEWLEEEIKTINQSYYLFNYQSNLPFLSDYDKYSKPGLDRLAAMSAATLLFPNKNVLVIDCGTCITCSFLNQENKFIGGTISPGINLRFKALHNFTSQLPLYTFDSEDDFHLIGKSTEESIKFGVINGISLEIDGIIGNYKKNNFNEIEIILCGGDANFFETKLKNKITALPELVLIGLNKILTLNN